MDLNNIDPLQHLMELEDNLNTMAEKLRQASEIIKHQSATIEQIFHLFKPVAHRIDCQQVELNELRRRIEYLEAIND